MSPSSASRVANELPCWTRYIKCSVSKRQTAVDFQEMHNRGSIDVTDYPELLGLPTLGSEIPGDLGWSTGTGEES